MVQMARRAGRSLVSLNGGSEGPRWTRSSLGSSPPTRLTSLTAALPAERRVLARRGWAGGNRGLFEHPETILTSTP